MAAEIVQIPVGGGAEPQAGAAVPACQLHRVPADLHAVIVAAATAGDTVGPGGDVLELREVKASASPLFSCAFSLEMAMLASRR